MPFSEAVLAQDGKRVGETVVREESLIAVGQQESKLASGNLGGKIAAAATVDPLAVEVGNSVNVEVDPSPGPSPGLGPGPYNGILFPLVGEKQLPESSEPCCETQTSDTITVLDTASQEDTLEVTELESTELESTELEVTEVESPEVEDNNIGDYETEIVSGDVV